MECVTNFTNQSINFSYPTFYLQFITRELLIKLIEYLLENYGFDIQVTKLLQATRIHILPSLNPDGFDAAIDYEYTEEIKCLGDVGRNNSNDRDLNRDFKDYFFPWHRREGQYQPETMAVMKWLKNIQFVLSGGLHAGGLVANYPYDNAQIELRNGKL